MVSDVAHELRSPVTNLRCGLESIQDGLAAPDAERIDALHSETLLLQRLIGDLQDLALADSGGPGARIERLTWQRSCAARSVRTRRGPRRRAARRSRRRARIGRCRAPGTDAPQPAQQRAPAHARRAGGSMSAPRGRARPSVWPLPTPAAALRRNTCRTSSIGFIASIGSRDRATGGAGLGLAIVRQSRRSSKGIGRGVEWRCRPRRHLYDPTSRKRHNSTVPNASMNSHAPNSLFGDSAPTRPDATRHNRDPRMAGPHARD